MALVTFTLDVQLVYWNYLFFPPELLFSASELVSTYIWFFKSLSPCLCFFLMFVYLFFNSWLIVVSSCEGTILGNVLAFPHGLDCCVVWWFC